MTINQDEYKSAVGLDSCYIAQVVEDSLAAYSAGTPMYLAPSIEISAKPKIDQSSQYADNQVFDVTVSESETDLEVTIPNCPLETLAMLTGKQFDVTTGRVVDMPGVPPYFALGFRSQKSNKKNRFFWYQKVQFSIPEEAYKTIADKAEPQTVKLAAKAIKTIHQYTVNGVTDGIKRVLGDEDTDAFVATDWFTQVQVPGVTTPSALALSSSTPANNATNVSKSADITLTFNNKLAGEYFDNVTLLNESMAIIPWTQESIDDTGKILTLKHGALAGTTVHAIVYTMLDIFGQTISGVVKFTTGA